MPVSKLDGWREWMQRQGVEIVTKPVDCSPFGVRIGGEVFRIYVRHNTHAGGEIVHASIYGPTVGLAKQYLKETAPPGK